MANNSEVRPAAADVAGATTEVAHATAEVADANTEVVNQTYRECLNAVYERDYYQALHSRTIQYARVYDYSIGLGSAVSGGSGLGILADPKFAWLCGIVTTVSVLLSIAKGVWDWPGKTKFALERVQFYDRLYSGYRRLVDDINAAKQWNADFAKRRNDLRDGSTPGTPDPYPQLRESVRRIIQDSIKKRMNYTSWWQWKAT
jgi:hypothetical protein